MAFLEPCLTLKLIDCLKNGFCTYSVCSVWVSEVSCKIDLVWLYLLKKLLDDVDVSLAALTLLYAAGLIERQVEEVAVCLVVEPE